MNRLIRKLSCKLQTNFIHLKYLNAYFEEEDLHRVCPDKSETFWLLKTEDLYIINVLGWTTSVITSAF